MPLSSSTGYSDLARMGLTMVQMQYEKEDQELIERSRKRLGPAPQYNVMDFRKEESGVFVIKVMRSLPHQLCSHSVQFFQDGSAKLSQALCED